MKTRYRYIHFIRVLPMEMWECRTNRGDDLLGCIAWYRRWRQWCFMPDSNSAVFSRGCLNDISQFIASLIPETDR